MLVDASMERIDDVSLVGCLFLYMEAQFACNSMYTCYLIQRHHATCYEEKRCLFLSSIGVLCFSSVLYCTGCDGEGDIE